jgi:hypothetical protein
LREKGERGKMGAKKIAAMAVDISAGFIVVLIGLEMLPLPLNVIWGIFNAWLWIACPTLILWAKNKEDARNSFN